MKIKENTTKNNLNTFIAAFIGASIMPIIEILFFETSPNLNQQFIFVLLVAVGVTVGFILFRYIFN